MKKILLLFLLIITPVFASTPVQILKILDGDTIKVELDSGNKFSIRLTGIDCYETSKINRAYKQAYMDNLNIDEVVKQGEYATKYLKKMYKDTKEVSFDFRGIDMYGRVLGIVWFDNINVNKELKEKGICKEFIFEER